MTSRGEHIPSALLDLLGAKAVSVGTVELLMLLRNEPAEARPIEDICAELECPRSWAELQLSALQDAGLVARTGDDGYSYAPATQRRRDAVEALAREWDRDRVEVSRRIFAAAKPGRRRNRG